MPNAALRPCSGSGCRALVSRGRCPACTRKSDRSRRTTRVITYSETWWRKWRETFTSTLVSAGILPVCGARLPGGPHGYQTRCQAEGRQMTGASADGSSLHVHHEPELSAAEAVDRAAVCDLLRCVLACAECHAERTGAGKK
jgi:hypothetical protein